MPTTRSKKTDSGSTSLSSKNSDVLLKSDFFWTPSPTVRRSIFVALIAILIYRNIDFIIVLLPKYVDAYFLRSLYSREKVNMNTTFTPPLIATIPPMEANLGNITELFDPHGYPRHVKNMLNIDHNKIIDLLSEKNSGKTMRMLSFENWNTPHISTSCNQFKVPKEIAFDEFAKNHLYQEASDNHSDLYAGFEAITDSATLDQLLGLDIQSLGDYRQNNLFASNFKEEIMSAGMHCAPIDSLTFQLIGTKTWYFASPENLAEIKNIPMPTAFPLPLTDDELLEKLKTIYIVKQEPGDVVYFGPHWCHAVSTSKGPNVMFNLRYNNPDLIKAGPISLSIKVLIRLLTRTLGGLPQENTKEFPLIFSDLNSWFKDCGVSKAMVELFEKIQKM